MFVMDEAKFPPPTPATAATASSVLYETPGRRTNSASTHGTSSSEADTIVQLRPPNRATANVYGTRTAAPSAAGSVVSRNLPAASIPYAGPRNSTSTDHSVHTENPMCSEKMENTRFRRATRAPVRSQKVG